MTKKRVAMSNALGKFYRHILPQVGIKALVTKEHGSEYFRHHPVSSLEELANKTELFDKKHYDVYFACASYTQGFYMNREGKNCFRTAENAGWAKSYWLDIDCSQDKAIEGKGYKTVTDAMSALQDFCDVLGMPMPTIILSGGGLHCYFVLEREVNKEQWIPIAKKLKALTHHYKLLADDSRSSDIASILRPLGTHNWKPEHRGKEVQLHHLSEPISFQSFSSLIDEAYRVVRPVEVFSNSKSKDDFPETDENIKRVKAALMLLNPNCDRAFWRDICFALHSLGWSCSKDLAKSWSRGGLI